MRKREYCVSDIRRKALERCKGDADMAAGIVESLRRISLWMMPAMPPLLQGEVFPYWLGADKSEIRPPRKGPFR